MRVLIACEESQTVCKAFRELGHEAYSCDVQACSGGRPEWHIMHDAVEVSYSGCWDLMVAHPPCTYFSCAGLHYLKTKPERQNQLAAAFDFLSLLWSAPIARIALENPVGWLNTNWRKPTQIIEPYYFGDSEKKRTCLWLKNLPRLNGIHAVALNRKSYAPLPSGMIGKNKVYFCERMKIQSGFSFKEAAKLKSKTFPGIARAMAEQWGRVEIKSKAA